MNEQKIKVLVVGANGQLGKQFHNQRHLFPQLFLMSKQSLNILDLNQISKVLKVHQPDIVINCAAYTDVVGAEQNTKEAYDVNQVGVCNIAEICSEAGVKLIHISTDSVFDGNKKKPYNEQDAVNPLNEYSRSKWAGEQEMFKRNPDGSSVIRVSWLYSNFGNNFYEKIIAQSSQKVELKVVDDQFSTPTYARGLVEFIANKMINTKHRGCELFHFSDIGKASWYEFAREIIKLDGGLSNLIPISTEEFCAPVTRPKYTVLSHQKIVQKFNYSMSHWKQNLERCLYDRKK